MSTSGRISSHHPTVKIAVDSLQRCLSNPDIDEAVRLQFINAFQDQLIQQLESTNKHHSDDSDDSTTTGSGGHFDPIAQELHKLVHVLNNCWVVSQPESSTTLSSPNQLPERLLQYLFCFSLLGDEAAVMTRRQLIYWWVGLGLIDVEDGQDAEDAADVVLRELVEAAAIEQLINSKKQRTSKYRRIIKSSDKFMEDHLMVGMLKKEGANLKLAHHPSGSTIDDDKSKARIDTLFNPDVSVINIKREWLRTMRSVRVFHLGSWSNDKSHMEVETVEFLQALKYLTKVRFISFKGISRIMKLADEICSLGDSLRVLDLRDCSNLEMLPKGIGRLKNLTHLDLSECFLLDRIPKGIIALTKLQVLKGFVITDVETSSSCKFKDLADHLGKTLKKLSIRTRKVNFPIEDDLKAFPKFEKLEKLKVEWVRISDSDNEEELQKDDGTGNLKESHQEDSVKPKDSFRARSLKRSLGNTFRLRETSLLTGLPEKLQKLEVHGIPQAAVKSLMLRHSHRLQQNLKKLYVIGGDVSDLTDRGKIKWESVETLRVKYLTKVHMSWMQLEISFPMVTHVEMVDCPFLTFFPCDLNGVWEAAEVV